MDEESWSKVVLICKPEQSGKTFIMIQQIIKDLDEPIQGKTVINFIFCDNNLRSPNKHLEFKGYIPVCYK